jgi:hypothetical protein
MMIRFRAGNDRGVAQPGSASALGAEGRRFESCLPDHHFPSKKIMRVLSLTYQTNSPVYAVYTRLEAA